MAVSSVNHRHIVVIGAGPYGLALAAQLQAVDADFAVFGKAMSFWREHVPLGTRLLTDLLSCSFCRPGSPLDCAGYERALGRSLSRPLQSDELAEYGLWFQGKVCPGLDERLVVQVARKGRGFAIRLDDGGAITADHLILAIGLKSFAYWPPQFAGIPPQWVSHSSDLHDLQRFRGHQVAIIGRGQSALDCAALAVEAGADVEVIARSGTGSWADGTSSRPIPAPLRELPIRKRVRAAAGELLRQPDVFSRLPAGFRIYWLTRFRTWRPSLALIPRLGRARLSAGRTVSEVEIQGDRLRLRLDDHSVRTVDHVVLGTGYHIDVDAIGFLDAELRGMIARRHGYPELNRDMQCSLPQLYFVGAAAAWKFGPLMWFLRGAPWAAKRIAGVVSRR